MVSSLHQSIKRRWGTAKTSVANKLDERNVGRWSIQGYKDIQRLNQLIYDKKLEVRGRFISFSFGVFLLNVYIQT